MKILKEFRDFVNRGNVLDMAVGIIIGGAFTSIVNSLVGDIINPLLGLFGGLNFDQWAWNIVGDVTLNYGKFITACISFIIMAIVVFIMIKLINLPKELVEKKKKKGEPVPAPTTKICPYCKSEINIEATRCPHCTSELEK